MAVATGLWLLLGLALALLEWPYQALSELGFRLQRWGWPLPGLAASADGVAGGESAGGGASGRCDRRWRAASAGTWNRWRKVLVYSPAPRLVRHCSEFQVLK